MAELSLTLRFLHHPQRVLAYTPPHTIVESVPRRVTVMQTNAAEEEEEEAPVHVAPVSCMSTISNGRYTHALHGVGNERMAGHGDLGQGGNNTDSARANHHEAAHHKSNTRGDMNTTGMGDMSPPAMCHEVRVMNTNEAAGQGDSIHHGVTDRSAAIRCADAGDETTTGGSMCCDAAAQPHVPNAVSAVVSREETRAATTVGDLLFSSSLAAVEPTLVSTTDTDRRVGEAMVDAEDDDDIPSINMDD